MTDDELIDLAAQLGRALQAREWMLATAESCTGGWAAKLLTDIAGSSAWFERGFVTYSDAAKQELLDVRAATLKDFGAVSEQTARELAGGALAHSHADVALAITGIAGPSGRSPGKPVGLVYIALASKARVSCKKMRFFGNRNEIQSRAANHALDILRLELLSLKKFR